MDSWKKGDVRNSISATSIKGNQKKYIINNKYVKVDNFVDGWYESIAEVLISELQKYIKNGYPFVDYTFYNYKEKYSACISKDFLRGKKLITLENLLDLLDITFEYYSGVEGVQQVLGLMNMEYDLDIYDYLSYIIYLDALTLNSDRHLNNIAFIQNGILLKPSPIFDNGMGLLCSEGYDWNKRNKVTAKPFSPSFKEQAKFFERDLIQIDYEGLLNKLNEVESSISLYVVLKEQQPYLNLAINVLKERLVETRGELWESV